MNVANQQEKSHDAWCAIIRKAPIFALPVTLALLVSGSLWFQAVHYYFDIKHPTWIIWIVLTVVVLWRLVRIGVRRPALHALDITVLMFIVTIVISLYFRGLGDSQQAAIYVSAFIGLSYLAGRLMSEFEIKLFLCAMFIVVALSLPLLAVELALLPKASLLDDRIKDLFGAYYINNSVGLTLGGMVSLLIAWFVRPSGVARRDYEGFGLPILAVTLWLLVFVAARGGLIAALIAGGAALLCCKRVSVRRRSGILLFVITVISVSWLTLPSQRALFMKEVLTVSEVRKASLNSPQMRILLYMDALHLFRGAPIWGVGAGNFGHYAPNVGNSSFFSPHSSLLQAFSELGTIGGSLFSAIAVLTIIGLIRIARSYNNQVRFCTMAWLALVLWIFIFLYDQISGNYFTSYQFFAITGFAGAALATSRAGRAGGNDHLGLVGGQTKRG